MRHGGVRLGWDSGRVDEGTRQNEAAATRREQELGRLSFAFMLDQAAMGLGGLSSLDAILIMAINQANIAPLTHEPLTRIRHGRLEAPAPDSRRRPVSINAVANSLRMPFETVRRHVRRLEQLGACTSVDGGVIVPETYLASPGYVEGVMESHRRLVLFFHQANAAGLLEPLPRSAYPPEPTIPVRAAARILADYMLRTTDALLAAVSDLASVIVLLAVISADTGRTSVAEIAHRLGMPAETVRRHVKSLIDQGLVLRISTGLVTPYEVMERPAWQTFLRENAVNVQRLFTGLAERGVVEAWARLIPPMRGEDVSPARSAPPNR
ncbi:winged helix-turn-helix domain-containing protein [Phenylobacterium sp. J426]|uniref:winged helix-turn-helix domain-containing protein n=1 Tax=Phenylobacterium sp. J426 TaxID=2898439 RepID=UPI0021506EC3|nr:winged helix-turn-helix domain-containing protein [Phenylobacterium sp. J426]MCR5875650.1 winged helix-turn-helix domain-containing protein [Phenylobacterium sp. J426]